MSEYEIGYGKPPKDSRFKPGNNANPAPGNTGTTRQRDSRKRQPRTNASGAAAAAAATTATTATGALLSLIYFQRSPVDVVAIQGLHSARSVCAGHFNEAEAAGPTGVAIIDQRNRLYGAMLFEQRAHRGLVH